MNKYSLSTKAFNAFNQVVSDILERDAVLIFPEEIKTECPNCYLDTMNKFKSVSIYKPNGPEPFDRGQPCPHCGGKGYKSTDKKETIKTRIYFDKKTIQKYVGSSPISISSVSLMTITNIKYLTKIQQAKYLTPNYDGVENYYLQKFEKLTDSTPSGFYQNEVKYFTTFWTMNK